MTAALLRLLPEFDAAPPARLPAPAWRLLDRPAPTAALLAFTPDEPPEPEPEAEPAPDPVAEAVAAALAEAGSRHAAALEEAQAEAAEALAEARARWAAEEGQALAAAFALAVSAAGDGIADAAASLLEPFVGEAIRTAAMAELRDAVADLVTGGAGGRITIAGPQDLLDALKAALARDGLDPERFDVSPSDRPEVEITADSSVVRTRLGDWMTALRRRNGTVA